MIKDQIKFSVSELVNKTEVIEVLGDELRVINNIAPLGDPSITENTIFWCGDDYLDKLKNHNCGVLVISELAKEQLTDEFLSKFVVLIVKVPRMYFKELLTQFFIKKISYGQISNTSSIDSSVSYDEEKVIIGKNVVIEENVKLGEYVVIGHNTVVEAGTVIESNVTIGANCTIGGIGFGYEKTEGGEFQLIPHIGNVHICSGVEIGNNTCVDKAVLGSTFIGKNSKIDNLVHIAHGVKIGENCVIIANAMIAGSVEIEDNVWVAPSSSILDRSKIQQNALIGMGAVVIKDIDKDTIVVGNPARKI